MFHLVYSYSAVFQFKKIRGHLQNKYLKIPQNRDEKEGNMAVSRGNLKANHCNRCGNHDCA